MNTTLFDYQGKLRQGELQLFAWPVPETMADQLNPVGTVVSNIDTVTSVSLSLEFQRYSNAVVYPSFDTVIALLKTYKSEGLKTSNKLYLILQKGSKEHCFAFINGARC